MVMKMIKDNCDTSRIQYLTDWEVAGYWPVTPLQGVTMETGIGILPVTPWIKAEVPGEIHYDLWKNGLIEDPYYELNSIKSEWVENRWWVYRTDFCVEKKVPDEQLFLVFRGIDYKAHIFLNNEKVAEHVGMYVPCRIDITNCCKEGKNHLRVVIEQIPDEMGQVGFTSKTTTQKARFGYKWDFGTRMVSLGLYDDVYIEHINCVQIEEVQTVYSESILTVKVLIRSTNAENATLQLELSYENEPIVSEIRAIEDSGWREFTIFVKSPQLWWPNGYGAQPLYQLKLTALNRNIISDEKNLWIGLRTLSYYQCEDATVDSFPYIVSVNGTKMPIKGVNLTPLDHMYGAVSYERYEKIVCLAKEANVNLIRVWGGGIIEKEVFYDLCDRHGIMVWQDFIQSSSGLDNIPSEDSSFMDLLAKTAEHAVREKRNHACLAVWCGGNELMDENSVPVTFENKNIAVLKKIVTENDSGRLFLPSTASGPNSWNSKERPENNHDIHGPWKYLGSEAHYQHFNDLHCLLLGECGVDGMNNIDTLRKILSPENQRVFSMKQNFVWAHHGQLWDTYAERDKPLFGKFEDLEIYVSVSQYMQAEGIRYAIESQMRAFPKTAGICIWQLNEPWPNVCCSNLVDYYGNPKFAYYYVKNAFRTLHVSLKYESLMYSKNAIFIGEVFIQDELSSDTVSVSVDVFDSKKTKSFAWERKIKTDRNHVVKTMDISFPVENLGEVFYVECTIRKKDAHDKNTYMFFVSEEHTISGEAIVEFVKNFLEK